MSTRRGSVVALAFWLACVVGCGSSKMTMLPAPEVRGPQVRTLAVGAGGVLADAIALELAARGFGLVPSWDASTDEPVGVIEATWIPGAADGYPDSAVVRVTASRGGAVLAGVVWENGWGGESGSTLDRAKRKSIAAAAREMAEGLARQLVP